MRLIKHVEVRNFRSIRSATIDGLNSYVPIVGLNGSGKSNLLRALSLFFNAEVEPGVPMDMKRDHHDPGRRFGGRRRIAVRITFDLSQGYEARSEVQGWFDTMGVEDELTIERAWFYADPSGRVVEEEFVIVDGDRASRVEPTEIGPLNIFIRSIKLRYLPNHVTPSEVMAVEIQSLRTAMNRRVRRRAAFRKGNMQEALDELGKVATEMLAGLSHRIAAHSSELSEVVPTIPNDFAELAFQLGLETVTSTGVLQAPELQGSGTQSYILFHLLDLIDNSVFEGDFGWTKAVVWAVEEPESFLHAGLRTRLAQDLLGFSSAGRRQVFLTTHEPEFQRPAEVVWLAEQAGAVTSFRNEPARAALVSSSRLRISSYQHPLYLSPDRPLVIVEGILDRAYLEAAAEAANLKPAWTMISLGDLEETKTGGSDVKAYLKANASVLKSRPLHAPVIVVRDWEDTPGEVAGYNAVLSQHETSCCVRPPESLCNPQLGKEFRGIERFLPTDLVEQVLSASVRPKNLHRRYPLHIDGGDLSSAKNSLLAALSERAEPGSFLVDLVKWLDSEVMTAIGNAPTRQMLLPY